jgi:acylphosphatase
MKHVLITGDVQGVGFRQFIKYQAKKLNIKGWVKNLPASRTGDPNGLVEAVFSGTLENEEKMVNFAKNGPILADVKSVEIEEVPDENFEDFEIIK